MAQQFLEVQAELNRWLSGPGGQKIKEYKERKLDAYQAHLRGELTPYDLDIVFSDLAREYALHLDRMAQLFEATRVAYRERRDHNKPKEDPILVQLLDGDHPNNPHRKADELS